MKYAIAMMILTALAAPCLARPNLSQEEAAKMLREGRTLRSSVATPRPMQAWGSLKDSDWTRKGVEAEKGYWRANAAGGVFEAEVPAALWGKTFKVVVEGRLRGGALQSYVVSKEGLQLRDLVSYNSPLDNAVKGESVVTCPPKGARIRLETSAGSWLRIDSVKLLY